MKLKTFLPPAAVGAFLVSALMFTAPVAAHDHARSGAAPASKVAAKATAAPRVDAALRAAIDGDHRTAEEKARDAFRHPYETLSFWGIRSNMTVVEIRPGGGYWTDILAPYLKSGGGSLIVTTGDPDRMNEQQRAARDRFLATFTAKPEVFGTIRTGVFDAQSTKPLAEPGTVDLVISSRNLHGFALQNIEAYAMRSIFDALKPGGLFAVEQHRGDPRRRQDPSTGYMRQDMVIAAMRRAGFEFVASSEINANPADTKDHPFGVWTLPPTLQTAPRGQPADPNFDTAKFRAIGESDRMTLLFRKPAA